ncbi:GatB/YqeY domain-containing protein [Patescibacteria group bacterium]|nr:GatB/YqeY domain-containing protein [Patescibacteria group bacterium]
MSLQQKIREELKEAMKARETVRVMVLKGLVSAFTNELVAQKRKPSEELGDGDVLNVIKRAVKQRKDSIEQFRKGGREDLAENEEKELEVLSTYLPETMSKEEIKTIAQDKKEELGIDDKAKMGILIGSLMKDLKDKADGGDVKEVVEGLF